MSEATRRAEADEVDQVLAAFAQRVIGGEPTADLFGVDENFIFAVLQKAHQFYTQKKFEKAGVLLKGVTVLDNQQAYAHLLLGDVLLQQKAYRDAADALERARELEPDNLEVLAKLGEAYVRVGKHADAVGILERSLGELDETSPHHKRAKALYRVATGTSSAPSEEPGR